MQLIQKPVMNTEKGSCIWTVRHIDSWGRDGVGGNGEIVARQRGRGDCWTG